MRSTLSLILFLVVITAVLASTGFYLHVRLTSISPWFKQNSNFIKFTILFFLILQLFGPMTYRLWPSHQSFPFILQWLTYVTLGFFSSLFFYFIFAEFFTFILKPLINNHSVTERRVFLGVGFLTLINGFWGLKNATSDPSLENVDIHFPHLPEDLHNLKCVQISDLHVGPTIKKDYVERLVQQVNATEPDLIFLTGDMCDGTVAHLQDQMDPIKNLKSKFGIYYITGNHEYYWNGLEWTEYFKNCNFKVLLNDYATITVGSSQLTIAGCTDLKAEQFHIEHKCDPIKAIANIPEKHFKIFLAHQPNTYDLLIKNNLQVDLQLSGHTHGGQFFPWSVAVYAAQKYIKGLYLVDSTYIYVNRGTGYWGPPIRFPEKAEVSLITLKKGPYLA